MRYRRPKTWIRGTALHGTVRRQRTDPPHDQFGLLPLTFLSCAWERPAWASQSIHWSASFGCVSLNALLLLSKRCRVMQFVSWLIRVNAVIFYCSSFGYMPERYGVLRRRGRRRGHGTGGGGVHGDDLTHRGQGGANETRRALSTLLFCIHFVHGHIIMSTSILLCFSE